MECQFSLQKMLKESLSKFLEQKIEFGSGAFWTQSKEKIEVEEETVKE